ncbi:hypothetical protein [Gracilibacillus sp. JCM 18860]|uniref:hypothetical protein n=1 Tax=Gracilibacillus sp. JCM 18860 TaxID=1306159 RepID=UPI0006CFAE83
MLFSSGGEEGYRTTYFGSLFFNSTPPTSEDTLEMQFGVANGIPIFITIAILFVLFIFILSLFKRKSAAS